MPKGFSDREKTLIRAQLLSKGRELFATQGIKKANVEDLTRAANISKGAFYLFFNSKEELFFEILGQFEDEYHANLIEAAARPGSPVVATRRGSWESRPRTPPAGIQPS